MAPFSLAPPGNFFAGKGSVAGKNAEKVSLVPPGGKLAPPSSGKGFGKPSPTPFGRPLPASTGGFRQAPVQHKQVIMEQRNAVRQKFAMLQGATHEVVRPMMSAPTGRPMAPVPKGRPMMPVPKGFVPGQASGTPTPTTAKRTFGAALAAATAEVKDQERATQSQWREGKQRRTDAQQQWWVGSKAEPGPTNENDTTRQRHSIDADQSRKQLWRGSRSIVPVRRSTQQKKSLEPQRSGSQERHRRSRHSHEPRAHENRSRHRDRSRDRKARHSRRRDEKTEMKWSGEQESRQRDRSPQAPPSSKPTCSDRQSGHQQSLVAESREHGRSKRDEGPRSSPPAGRRGLWRGSRSVVPQRVLPKPTEVEAKAVQPVTATAKVPISDVQPCRARALGVAVPKSVMKHKAPSSKPCAWPAKANLGSATSGNPTPPPGRPPMQARTPESTPHPPHPPGLSRPQNAAAVPGGPRQPPQPPGPPLRQPKPVAARPLPPSVTSGPRPPTAKPPSPWKMGGGGAQQGHERGQKRPLEPSEPKALPAKFGRFPGQPTRGQALNASQRDAKAEEDPLRRAFEEHVATVHEQFPVKDNAGNASVAKPSGLPGVRPSLKPPHTTQGAQHPTRAWIRPTAPPAQPQIDVEQTKPPTISSNHGLQGGGLRPGVAKADQFVPTSIAAKPNAMAASAGFLKPANSEKMFPALKAGDVVKLQAKQHMAQDPSKAKPSIGDDERRRVSVVRLPINGRNAGKAMGKGKGLGAAIEYKQEPGAEEYQEEIEEGVNDAFGALCEADFGIATETETEVEKNDLSARLRRTVERSEQLLERQRKVLAGQPDALKEAEALAAELASLQRDAMKGQEAPEAASLRRTAAASTAKRLIAPKAQTPKANTSPISPLVVAPARVPLAKAPVGKAPIAQAPAAKALAPPASARKPSAVVDLSAKMELDDAIAEAEVAGDVKVLNNGLRVSPSEYISFTGDWKLATPTVLRLVNSSPGHLAVKVMLNSRGAYTVTPSHQHMLKPKEVKELQVKAVGQPSPEHRIVVRSTKVAKGELLDKHLWAKLSQDSFDEAWLSVHTIDLAPVVGTEEQPVSSLEPSSEACALAAELRRLGVQGTEETEEYGEAAPAYDDDSGTVAACVEGQEGDLSIQGNGPLCPACGRVMPWSDYAEGAYAEAWSCNNVHLCQATSSSHGRWRWFCLACENDLCRGCWDRAVADGGTGFAAQEEVEIELKETGYRLEASADVYAEAEWYASETSAVGCQGAAVPAGNAAAPQGTAGLVVSQPALWQW